MLDNIYDISKWDTITDEAAFLATLPSAVIHKSTEGLSFVDPKYAERRMRWQDKMLFGAYHFLDNLDGARQADHFLSVVQPDGTFLLALDFESGLVSQAEAFIKFVKDKTGVFPLLYTRASFITQQIGSKPTFLSNSPLWIASYRDTPLLPPQWTNWFIDQYTNGTDGPLPHEVAGIVTVDRNRFNGDVAALKAFWQTCCGKAVIQPQVVTRWVTAQLLNVRSTPDLSSPHNIIGQLPQNAQVQINGAAIRNGFVPMTQDWRGLQGWVWANYLTDIAPAPVVVTSPPVPTPPATVSIGYGVQALGGAWDDSLAKYPCFKAVDNPSAVARYHQLNPGGLCDHRHYYAQDAHQYIGNDPHGAAQRWINENISTLKALPYALHEGFNESGSDPLIVAFEIERVTLMAQVGARACVLNLSTGTYNDDALWKRDDIKKLAALVEQHNGAIGLHCYGEGIMSSNCGGLFWQADGNWSGGDPFPLTVNGADCLLAMRVIRVREVLAEAGIRPMFTATELGLDDDSSGVYKPFGLQVRGWKDCIPVWQRMGWLNGTTPEAFYRRQLQWFSDVAKVPGFVYAWNDDTMGNITHQPGVFDVRGVL